MGATSSYVVPGSTWERYATITYQDVAVADTRTTLSYPLPPGLTLNDFYYTVTVGFDDGLGSPVAMDVELSGSPLTGVPLALDISAPTSKAYVLGATKTIPITDQNSLLELTITSQLVNLDTLTSGTVEVYLLTAKL